MFNFFKRGVKADSGGSEPNLAQPPRGWRPPERSLTLRVLDVLLSVVCIASVVPALLILVASVVAELETFMLPWLIGSFLVWLLMICVARPKKELVTFDHFAVIERWGQPHRIRGMGWVWYFPGLGERVFNIKCMRSESTSVSFVAHTSDGVKISGVYRVWIKPIEGTDPFSAAYRLAKTGGKADQIGKKCLEDLIGRTALQGLLSDRMGFYRTLHEKIDQELKTYFHRVRDGSLGELNLPSAVESAMQATFVTAQKLSTAGFEAQIKQVLAVAEPGALLQLFLKLLPQAEQEQQMRMVEMVMNAQMVQHGGQHISLSLPSTQAPTDASGHLLTATLAQVVAAAAKRA